MNRDCAHVIASEKGTYELQICPESGLSAQKYACAECKTPLPVGKFEFFHGSLTNIQLISKLQHLHFHAAVPKGLVGVMKYFFTGKNVAVLEFVLSPDIILSQYFN